jgi:uracil-DNA glycosylase family 4
MSSGIDQLSEAIRSCTQCKLHLTHTKAVPGSGDPNAQVLFIGEAPGANEDKQGLPFIGDAGKQLDELLASVQLPRSSVYITNIVKCRPPGNREPEPDEIGECSMYIYALLGWLDPKLIVTLGRFSMHLFLPGATIGNVHGKEQLVDHDLILPLYHPAAGLHNPMLKPVIRRDFLRIRYLLDREQGLPGVTTPYSGDEPF